MDLIIWFSNQCNYSRILLINGKQKPALHFYPRGRERHIFCIPKRLQHSSKKKIMHWEILLPHICFQKASVKKFIMNISNTELAHKTISAYANFPKPCSWLCFYITEEAIVLTEHSKMTFWWCMLIYCSYHSFYCQVSVKSLSKFLFLFCPYWLTACTTRLKHWLTWYFLALVEHDMQ